MRKTNCLHLLLTAAALAAMPLIAVSARAGVGDIYETNNGMILKFVTTGGTPATFESNLTNPKGLAFDGNGHVYVADAGRGIIIRFNTIDGQGGVTFAAALSSPIGLTFDLLGNLVESDAGTGSIFKFSTVDGTKTTFATGLSSPAGLAFDGSGNLFVADFSGSAIYKFTPDGTKTTFASGLSFPAGLAIDSSNNVFESDSGTGTIFKFTPDGTKTSFATGLSTPYGLAFDGAGNLIEADKDSGSTIRFSPAGDRVTLFTSNFNTPEFVAVEPTSHLLLNISTRGFVQGGEHVLIAGFIVSGNGPIGATIAIRAIGPSLSTLGILDPLPDPVLEVRDSSGALVAFNDNWADAPLAQRIGPNLQPADIHESALQLVLQGGSFTAIVSGAGGLVGTALVEVYDLQ